MTCLRSPSLLRSIEQPGRGDFSTVPAEGVLVRLPRRICQQSNAGRRESGVPQRLGECDGLRPPPYTFLDPRHSGLLETSSRAGVWPDSV